MRHDGAGNAGAVNVRALGAAERIEIVGDGIGKFRMLGVDAGVDHGDRHVGAMRQRMCLRQAELGQRILRRIPSVGTDDFWSWSR